MLPSVNKRWCFFGPRKIDQTKLVSCSEKLSSSLTIIRLVANIRILPEVLAHQIAAGEIVERPSSVVKELLENALDAEATQIVVEAEEAGKRLLSVRDDGIGMDTDNAKRAFQHHATSKIQSLEDLDQIQTLGFRGEALPSIASISRLCLKTIDQINCLYNF